MTPSIHLFVLASGSKGNAAIVQGPEGSILIDDGISYKALRTRAQEVAAPLDDICAVLLTHEHGDHTSGLSVFCNHFDGPLFATAGTVAGRSYLQEMPFELIQDNDSLDLAGMHIRAFPTSHDVNDPVGFRFDVIDGEGEIQDSLGWCTDTGYVTDEALDALYGCRILGLESNHDEKMLETGPYPRYLKDRVKGEGGHLSNAQAAAVLPHLVTKDTECVVALHLSEENNRPSVCIRTLAEALGAEPTNTTFTEVRTPDGLLTVFPASQHEAVSVW